MNHPMAFLEIPFILEQLNLMDARNNNNNNNNTTGGFNTTGTEGETSDDERNSISRRSIDDRALAPRISSLENSLVEHINSSVPSLDELVIRQRGRKKQPAKISWSPIKSPFKTPTKKNNSALHMSLLSPSPAKKLFANTSMTLRSSPRKRILVDTPTEVHDPASCSTPVSSPTKRLRLFDERPMNATNPDVPIKTLLKGLTHEQLMMIICDMSSKDPSFEEGVRQSLPSPDIRSFEEQLCSLRKNITKSSPRSRLLSRTDGPAFARASPHLNAFKKAIVGHCKILSDSHHFDALIDYVLMAWTYVAGLPLWDETSHNILRKDCFRILALNARGALRNGGKNLGSERVCNFKNRMKSMTADYDDIGKCQEALNYLA